MNSATMKSISLTSTSIPLELLSTENPLILVNIPTYQVSLHKITPLLTLKCRFIINWKTINSNVFVSCKGKTPKTYQSSVVYEFTCPGCNNRYIGKTDRCLYTRTKEHAYHTESVIHQHLSTCEQFQHIKALLELYPDDDAMSKQTSIMAEHVFHNTKIIDKSITIGPFCCIKNPSLFKDINLN